jgi:hypothetical protein
MRAQDVRYLALWKRANRVVEAYGAAGRKAEADYVIADFFLSFEDPNELEAHVEIAEEAAEEQGVWTKPSRK